MSKDRRIGTTTCNSNCTFCRILSPAFSYSCMLACTKNFQNLCSCHLDGEPESWKKQCFSIAEDKSPFFSILFTKPLSAQPAFVPQRNVYLFVSQTLLFLASQGWQGSALPLPGFPSCSFERPGIYLSLICAAELEGESEGEMSSSSAETAADLLAPPGFSFCLSRLNLEISLSCAKEYARNRRKQRGWQLCRVR